jgi:hypothetical protein
MRGWPPFFGEFLFGLFYFLFHAWNATSNAEDAEEKEWGKGTPLCGIEHRIAIDWVPFG